MNQTKASIPDPLIDAARAVLHEQSSAIDLIASRLGDEFRRAVMLLLSHEGRVIVSGMGKSGIIGKKIAATLASTGTPSFFVHPAEAYHGDLGMITPKDVLLLISYSGETEEVVRIVPWLKRQDIPYVSLTGNADSTLSRNATVHLDVNIPKESCPHNLAPTTSTTVTLAMGDALAVALMKLRDFKPHDFAFFHPGGSLGKRLLTRVEDVMHEDLPFNSPGDGIRSVIGKMTGGRLGVTLVTSSEGELLGVITDGDLRRAMMGHEDFLSLDASAIMTSAPVVIPRGTMFSDAELLMREKKINSLIVVEADGRPCGVVQIFDID